MSRAGRGTNMAKKPKPTQQSTEKEFDMGGAIAAIAIPGALQIMQYLMDKLGKTADEVVHLTPDQIYKSMGIELDE